MMKIVVTGALGHIGSSLIRELPRTFGDSEIFMVDNLRTNRYCSLFNLPKEGKYCFIEKDILKADLKKIFKGARIAVHLAAITDAAASFNNYEEVEEVNYYGTLKVAEACAETGCSLIHMSSTSVYGTQAEVVDECCPAEDLKPQSPYAEVKLKEEAALRSLKEDSFLRFICFRNGTICGISPGMRFHTAVNKFCWQAVTHQPITVWKTAFQQKRPYLCLSDAVRAIQFVMQKDLFNGNIYNVLTDNMTVQQIITYIERYVKDVHIEFIDSVIMNQLSYDVSNARFKALGFDFTGDSEICIRDTIDLFAQSGKWTMNNQEIR
jgi:nucleoside-diphosphate-sugar epimerase